MAMTIRARFFAAAVTLIMGATAFAEDFPSQPIEVVTHASAGGGTDTTARTMLIRARRTLDTDAFVNIQRGGGGAVAMNYVAERPADGHTVMAITPTHLITMARGRAPIGIDDIRGVVRLITMARGRAPIGIDDIRGVVRSTDDPIIVVVNVNTGLTSIEELVAASQDSRITWGGTQAGGIDHIAAITFSNRSGADVAYVPFDGGGEIITNLMGGNIQAAGLNFGEAVDGIESGDFLPLAVMSTQRLGILPDTPTLAELGIEGVNFSTVRGIVVMADTPDDRVAALEEGLLSAMAHGTYQNYLVGIGLDASSVAGSEVWDGQIREMYDSIFATLGELGLR
jgi:tripartite-type tricarboxylate transporter receptor subunit TctC